jgi:hypothetical protein
MPEWFQRFRRAGELVLDAYGGHVLDPEPDDVETCPIHSDVLLEKRMQGQPDAGVSASSLCWRCRADKARLARRHTEGTRTPEDHIVSRWDHLPGYSSDRVLAALDIYEAKQRAQGKLIPGSPEERAAVELADRLREEDIEREQQKNRPLGRYACSNGQSDFYEVRDAHGRKHLVEVPWR